MKNLAAALAVLAATAEASPFPQGVTARLPAHGQTPAGCHASHDGVFGMTVVPVKGKAKRRYVLLYSTYFFLPHAVFLSLPTQSPLGVCVLTLLA